MQIVIDQQISYAVQRTTSREPPHLSAQNQCGTRIQLILRRQSQIVSVVDIRHDYGEHTGMLAPSKIQPLLSCLLLGFVAITTGCGGTSTEEETSSSSGETGEPIPPNEYLCNCPEGVDNYQCFCYQGTDWQNQASSFQAGTYCSNTHQFTEDWCDGWCQSQPFSPNGYVPEQVIPCNDQEPEPYCGDWEPELEVTYDVGTDTYIVSWDFAIALWTNSEALVGCDDATISFGENGFEVGNANSGELLYELGLRNGDLIKKINNIDLEDYADANYAFMDLWLVDQETNYALEIERSSVSMQLDYYLDPGI